MVVRLFLVVVKLIRSKYVSYSKILELFHILAIRVAMLFFASDCLFFFVVVFFVLLVCLFFVFLLNISITTVWDTAAYFNITMNKW